MLVLEQYFTPYQTQSAVSGDRVAILAPHPDDEVFGCGGSACKWSEQGKQVQAFVITSGVVAGEFGDTPEAEIKRAQKAQLRADESRAAAKTLGLPEPEFFARQDAGLLGDQQIESMLLERLVAWQPTTLVVPSIWEMHRDHRATAQLGLSLARKIKTVQRLAFYEVGVPMTPNCLENISDYQDRKWQAMHNFPSQLQGQRYAAQMRGLNTFRSYTLGLAVHYAEAFYTIEADEIETFMAQHQPNQTTLTLMHAESQAVKQQQQSELMAQRIHELERMLHQTHQTLSWRITRPLRWLRSKL